MHPKYLKYISKYMYLNTGHNTPARVRDNFPDISQAHRCFLKINIFNFSLALVVALQPKVGVMVAFTIRIYS